MRLLLFVLTVSCWLQGNILTAILFTWRKKRDAWETALLKTEAPESASGRACLWVCVCVWGGWFSASRYSASSCFQRGGTWVGACICSSNQEVISTQSYCIAACVKRAWHDECWEKWDEITNWVISLDATGGRNAVCWSESDLLVLAVFHISIFSSLFLFLHLAGSS